MPADPELLFDGPADASRTVALAHGAGAGMDSPFLDSFAKGLGGRGFRVVRFEYPYMASNRVPAEEAARPGAGAAGDVAEGDRTCWGKAHLVIGGKSMGGRIASLVADEAGVAGLVCLGYPFHPIGKPDRLRVEHLRTIRTPTLIVQGERDPFGSREEVAAYKLSKAVRVAWMTDGDHSFKPRKSSGRTEQQNWEAALDEIVTFPGSSLRGQGKQTAEEGSMTKMPDDIGPPTGNQVLSPRFQGNR